MTSTARADDDVARPGVSGPLTRRKTAKTRLRPVTVADPYGLKDVTARDLKAELERRTGTINRRGRAKRHVETPKLVAAIVRMSRAAGRRVGPGMDIASLDKLAELRDQVELVIGDAARELTRPSRPEVTDADGTVTDPGEPNRKRYSWTDVANALGFRDRQTAHDRYADPAGPRKRDGNPDRPRRASRAGSTS